LVEQYPLVFIEDGLAEEDWDGWAALTTRLPTPRRCLMATSSGRVMFDAAIDVGPAGDVPREAYRRFRADRRGRREDHVKRRSEDLALHEEKTRLVAEWVGAFDPSLFRMFVYGGVVRELVH